MKFLYLAWEADYTPLTTLAYRSAIYTYGMTFLYLAWEADYTPLTTLA